MTTLKVKRVHPNARIPRYQTKGAACFDLHSTEEGTIGIGAMQHVFGTGLKFEIPEDHVMLIFSRSGHGFKNDVRLANCVGVIDSDYRGEVKVKLTADQCNHFPVAIGDRIAQAMVIEAKQVEIVLSDELSETDRGEGGFGSTGQSVPKGADQGFDPAMDRFISDGEGSGHHD